MERWTSCRVSSKIVALIEKLDNAFHVVLSAEKRLALHKRLSSKYGGISKAAPSGHFGYEKYVLELIARESTSSEDEREQEKTSASNSHKNGNAFNAVNQNISSLKVDLKERGRIKRR